jgi:hypothetical protein
MQSVTRYLIDKKKVNYKADDSKKHYKHKAANCVPARGLEKLNVYPICYQVWHLAKAYQSPVANANY